MKYTAENMDRELQAAKKVTKDRLCAWKDLVDGYAGPFHSDGVRQYNPENHAYEWVVNTLMQVVQDNPRCSLKSKRGGMYQLYAEGMRAAVDQWCVNYELDNFLRTGPGLNLNFARGIAYVDLEDHQSKFAYQPGPKEDPYDQPVMPICRDVDPNDFVCDPTRDNPGDWMYSGHRTIWDKDELLEKAKADNEKDPGSWDLKVLEAAVSAIGSGDSDEARKRDGIDRNEIVLWELWCPRLEVDGDYDPDLYHGAIVTLIDYAYQDSGGTYQYPRKPRAYYGPKEGPYALFDALKKPGDGWPVAPLVASKGQADELNAESRAITRGMDSWKRILITTDKELTKKLKAAPTDTVHTLSAGALKDSIVSMEVGGLSAEQLTAFQFRRERVDRVSGLTEAARGQASTGNTATADVIANAGAQIRMALLKAAVERGTRQLLYRVLWYIFHENQIAIFLGMQQVPQVDPETGEPMLDEQGQPVMAEAELWHRGGPADARDAFDSYEFELEPYSMERTSEGLMARQAAFLVQDFPQVAALMPQTPHVPWEDWASAMADLLNMPSIKKLVNGQVLQQLQALMLQMQMQPQTTTGPTSKPQTARAVPTESPKAPPTPTPGGGGRPTARPAGAQGPKPVRAA